MEHDIFYFIYIPDCFCLKYRTEFLSMDETTDDLYEIRPLPEIVSDKLPSQLEVLQNVFYHTRELNQTIADGTLLVIENVLKIWNDVGIPVMEKRNCVSKLKILYEKWRYHQKKKNTKSQRIAESLTAFKSDITNLFDISSSDAATKCDSVRVDFLNSQKQHGRIGSIQDLKSQIYFQGKYQIQLNLIYYTNSPCEPRMMHWVTLPYVI